VAAVALALAASLAWGSSDFLAGIKSRNVAVLSVLVVSQGAGLVLVLAAASVWGGALPDANFALWAVAAGAAELIGFAALYRGLAVGAMSVVAPISATAALVPLIVGLAAGERTGTLQSAGIGLALAGIALASIERSAGGAPVWRTTAGLGLALLAALGFGAFFVGMDRASDGGILWAVALNRCASLTLLVLFAAATRRRVGVAGADRLAVIGVGTLDIAANVLFAAALTFGLTGMVAVLGSMYPVTTVLLARVVLKDRIARRQELGVGGALVGVALVTVAS
jgi:drug/metabolite transporter (DMT)-like permease